MRQLVRGWLAVGGPVREWAKQSLPLRYAVRRARLTLRRPDFRPLGSAVQETPRSRVLVATSAGGFLEGNTIDGLLSAALQERDAEVHALLCDRFLPACQECTLGRTGGVERMAATGPRGVVCPGCFEAGQNSYEALGVRIHRFGELLNGDERERAAAFARDADLTDPMSLTFDRAPVGEHATAGALRYFGRATFEGEPLADAVLRRFLEAAALTTLAAQHVLELVRPDVIVAHHGIYVPQGILAEVARSRGVRVVTWNSAYRSRSFVFSHDTTYHHTMLTEPVSEWETIAWTDETRERLLAYLQSRWTGANDWITFAERPTLDVDEIERETGVDFSRPCIGMLTNVMWDAQLLYRTNAFPNMVEWCIATIEHFRRRPELQLLIRVHPAELKGYIPSRQPIIHELLSALGRLPENVFVIPPESSLSTYAAMLQCDAAIVYATKTGVELTALGLPVIVAGDAWVRNKGITLDASSPTDYEQLLRSLPLGRRLEGEQLERAQKYAFHFFFRRMIPIELVEPTRHGEPKYTIAVSDRAQLQRGRSLGLDIVCDGVLTGSPFVFPAETVRRADEAEIATAYVP